MGFKFLAPTYESHYLEFWRTNIDHPSEQVTTMCCNKSDQIRRRPKSPDKSAQVISLRRMETHLRFVHQTHRPAPEKKCDTCGNIRLQSIALRFDGAICHHLCR